MAPAQILVRDAAERDLERVSEIKISNWRDTYAPLVPAGVLGPFLDAAVQLEYIREVAFAPGTILLVAEDSTGTVVGFALTYLDRPPEPWLESLHVIAGARGSGAGTVLMRATARRIKQRGNTSLALGVVEGNASAERFYERLGGVSGGFEPAEWAPTVRHHIYRWPNLDALA